MTKFTAVRGRADSPYFWEPLLMPILFDLEWPNLL